MDMPHKVDDVEQSWTLEDVMNKWNIHDLEDFSDDFDNLVDSVKSDKVDIRTKSDICWEHVPFLTIRTFAVNPDMFHMWVELIFCDNPVEAVNQFDWNNPDNMDNWQMLVQMPLALHW